MGLRCQQAVRTLFYKVPCYANLFNRLFGAVVVHFVNIAMSNLARDVGGSKESPCTWYFLNILVDTTIGVAILWYALRTLDALCVLLGVEGLNISYWLKQACVYTIGLLLMKFAVFLILHVVPQLGGIGSFLLRWTEYSERLRIVVVMAVFPLIMNVIQYIIIDNIVKAPSKHTGRDESSRLVQDGQDV
ncbi:Vaculolar membrane protein-domain-containing protein [Protomyces lactucae-debilis]|uniref:Vaculolar membrane protein-domain-containing protein n=1 Tax=Protomyces lactucae-debilis TaxID=2754530 RepID=A0A1Y2FLX0_PROLT|nr:vacuolar membrane protein-domain-containing protein [Protomyces lactucae-debilis]ORY84216.1 Vaculolar membrane protein-domain-containing protein [Protomyces lactucae-debilis]